MTIFHRERGLIGFEIINAKKKRLTDEDIRTLAEMEKHLEVTKWDVSVFEEDLEKAYEAFKKFLEKLSRTEDEFLVAKVDKKVVGFVEVRRLKGKIGEMRHVDKIGITVHLTFKVEELVRGFLKYA